MLVRALIVLLACMNLGVALWWGLHRDPPPPPLPPLDPGVGTLVLASERPSTPVVDAAELSTDPEPLPPGSSCMSLGPFEDAAALRSAMNTLLPLAERIQFREVAATVLRGYRVLLPPAASRADAQAIARDLATRGIDDYYVITAGPEQNSVALGTYKDLPNATQRRDAIAALGYAPQLEPRMESTPQWWIDLAARAGVDPRAALGKPALEARPVACQ
jgi:hypothetical protein